MAGSRCSWRARALEVDWFRLGRDRYFIPLAVKIPGSQIELARKKGLEETTLEFIGQVRNSKGVLAATVRDSIKVKLRGDTAGQLGRRLLQYDTGFTLTPGDYALKFLARENETGKLGTFETKFKVPDLAAPTSYLRLSSVVWANQREPLAAAAGAAERSKRLLATHPLVKDGQKLIPSITKVFRKDQKLYVYFEVYDLGVAAERKTPNIAATLSFFRGKVKAFESEPLRVTQASARGRAHHPGRVPGAAGEPATGRVHLPGERDRPGGQQVCVRAVAAGAAAVGGRFRTGYCMA